MECIKAILNYEFLFCLFLILGLAVSLYNIFCVKLNDPSKYMLKRILTICPYILFIISALFAYLQAGNNFRISLFNAFGSFIYVNISCTESNYIYFFKIFAVIVTANTLIPSIRNFVKLIIFYIAEKFGKTVYVIYGDSSTSNEIMKNFEKLFPTIKVEDHRNKMFYSFNNHIVAYENDELNMKLADELYSVKHNKSNNNFNIYAISNGCDSLIFRDSPINVLNKNDLIVNNFWEMNYEKIFNIFSSEEKNFTNCNISIIGSNELSYCFFKHVLKNFIFDKNQSINFNVFTSKNMLNYFQLAENSIKEMITKDTIHIDMLNEVNIYECLQNSDIVICTDNTLLSKVSISYRYGQLIYIYNPSLLNSTYEKYIDRINCGDSNDKTNIYMFGSDREIFTFSNIVESERKNLAMLINYGYEKNRELSNRILTKLKIEHPNLKTDEEVYSSSLFLDELNLEWNNQNFDNVTNDELVNKWDFKNIYKINSNYASADYYNIRRILLRKKTQEEMEWLEHTRWCRFMYLEGFKLGDSKNVKKKRHHLLKELKAQNSGDKAIFQIDSAIYKFLENNKNK